MNQIARNPELFSETGQRSERRLGRLRASAPPIAGIVIAVVLAAAGGVALAVRASRRSRWHRILAMARRVLT